MTIGEHGQYVAPRMRVRTAIALATAIVVVKATLIWVAMRGWWMLAAGTSNGRGNQWFAGHVAGGLALAAGTAAAVGALWFAASEERSWRARRRDQAKLVVVQGRTGPSGEFEVVVANYGDRPVLDVELNDACLVWHPDRKPIVDEDTRRAPTLEPGGTPHTFRLRFEAPYTGPRVSGGRLGCAGEHPESVWATVSFTDADGGRWTHSTTGSAERL